ncbi:Yos1-like protein [Dacryopinax primogenitus]|uniref:Yos1-like protein n=1 Tax=Dacryopinax primogenitus (strain DJM 731) TaxID=1858805 RepID=M5G8P0_DACPD|nr:Yos1-like protein [Dacryopinax primogenitus]EJU06581.1 Yos1-like protein [Dacryopinax primogenitus]
MAFSLGTILYVTLLLVNAIAVLNEERFLARIGLSTQTSNPSTYNPSFDQSYGGGPSGPSVRDQLVNLIGAVRTLLRLPLIAANVVVIVYELLLG